MAGELEFRSAAPDAYERCSLLAGVVSQGNSAVEFLEFGIDSDQDVIMLDFADPDSNNATTFEFTSTGAYSLDEPHHVLLISVGGSASLYVDGELVFSGIQVEARQGSYGIGLDSSSPASRCEGHEIWVYSFD